MNNANMRKIYCYGLCAMIVSMAFAVEKAEPNTDAILQCNAIFEARKDEITQNLRNLNEKMQSIEAYKNATQNLLDERQASLNAQENALKAQQESAKQEAQKIASMQEEKQKHIEQLIAKNESLLKEITTASSDKVAKTFSGMKDAKAAPIISELDDAQAASILTALSAADMAKILAKMEPKRAAELTKIIAQGPPFEPKKPKAPTATQEPADNNDDQLSFQEQGGV